MNGAKSKVIEDLEGAGVPGGLAPIIKVRISGPPGSGTLRRNQPEWVNNNPCSMLDSVILGAKSLRTKRAQGFGAA